MHRLLLIPLLLASALAISSASTAAEGGPPRITLRSPTSSTTLVATQTIAGVARDDSGRVALVTLSDGQSLRPESAGPFHFRFSVVLQAGFNQYRVSATDAAGNESVREVDFYLERGQVALNVGAIGQGQVTGSGIDCPSLCQDDAYLGSLLTLQATPSTGSVFIGWRGTCRSSRGHVCRLLVRGDIQTAAVFHRLVP